MFQPHHYNSRVQSERKLLDDLGNIRRTASFDRAMNKRTKGSAEEHSSSIEDQPSAPAPAVDIRNRPFGRWYIPILAVVAAGAAVAALANASETSRKSTEVMVIR